MPLSSVISAVASVVFHSDARPLYKSNLFHIRLCSLAAGLTCRVGRAIEGSAELVRDLLLSGRSVLLLGRPGVGKTTAGAVRMMYSLSLDPCMAR